MKARPLLFLVAILVAVVGPALPGSACSCVQPDPAAFLRTGEFVFVGSLLDREEAPPDQLEDVTYTFGVDAVYVGDIRDTTVAVRSAPNGAACGFEVVPGEPVGIAATLRDGALRSGLCQTVGAADLAAAADELGMEPHVPTEIATSTTTAGDVAEGADGGLPMLVIAAAGMGVLAIAAWAAVRPRSDH